MRLSIAQMTDFVLNVNTEHETWGHDESVIYHVNSEKLIAAWAALMNAGTGVAYGVFRDEVPAGFLLGLYYDDLLTGTRKASEYLWMVLPKYRSGDTSLSLLKEFESGAKADGCGSVVIGCNAAFKQKAMARWYQRLGYKSISESFERKL